MSINFKEIGKKFDFLKQRLNLYNLYRKRVDEVAGRKKIRVEMRKCDEMVGVIGTLYRNINEEVYEKVNGIWEKTFDIEKEVLLSASNHPDYDSIIYSLLVGLVIYFVSRSPIIAAFAFMFFFMIMGYFNLKRNKKEQSTEFKTRALFDWYTSQLETMRNVIETIRDHKFLPEELIEEVGCNNIEEIVKENRILADKLLRIKDGES